MARLRQSDSLGQVAKHINLCIIGTSHECHDILNHWQLQCLFNSLLMQTSKETSKVVLLVLCEGNPQVTGGFPSQRAGNVESVSMSFLSSCGQDYLMGHMALLAIAVTLNWCDH